MVLGVKILVDNLVSILWVKSVLPKIQLSYVSQNNLRFIVSNKFRMPYSVTDVTQHHLTSFDIQSIEASI